MDYPIPKTSAQAWRAHKKSGLPQNPGLIFDRFISDWGSSTNKEAKRKSWQEIEDVVKKADPQLLTAWRERWVASVQAVKAIPFSLKTDWRLVAGLGRKGSLEVGFTFHRYGFPIIPGSSVKGIARAWGLIQLGQSLQSEKLAELDKLLSKDDPTGFQQSFNEIYPQAVGEIKTLAVNFRLLFGTTANAGKVIFFDAIPGQFPELQLDIMNPHYPRYYQGKEAPTNWQSPVPIYFMTVAPQTEFLFAVGWNGSAVDVKLQKMAEDWLQAGLTNLGAGAKTSAGYGYFRLFEEKAKVANSEGGSTSSAKPSTTTSTPITEPLIWRSGITVGSVDTSNTKRGKVKDNETGEVYTFHISVIQGNTPGKNKSVEFVLQDGKVVALKIK